MAAALEPASEPGGRIVVVTGAAGNLGAAVADAFADRGASLVLVDLRRDALAARFGEERESRLLVAADLGTQAGANAVAAAALARFGRIDVLCNIAGAFRMGEAVHETSDDTWRFLFDVNVHSVLHMARAVVPPMLAAGGGNIVNVGANSAQRGSAHVGAYAASKSAVLRLTEAMSAELRERNINVNCVLPGVIDTPQNRAAMPGADPARWVSPADLAQVFVFLASPAARAIHGAAVPVVGLG
jgi:NAD(P)-dependent dehydrogenase (short-subunit alcohol dehydrogenase family)